MPENIKSSTKQFAKKNNRRAAPPKWIGRYHILAEAGRGATAFVYKAYDPQLDRHLAIKVLRQELANDDNYREAFIREARLAAQLTHPGIVTIFDVGIADGKPYIAMELLEGLTLQDVLQSQNKIDLQSMLAISTQLSTALNYAHKQGVIHRDIKPANIIVSNDKKTVKLTDFGIAHLDDSIGTIAQQTDKVLGTPEYMAPEQILGKPMDNRSDLYSFGVLMFQLLVGKPPFVDPDLGILFKQIIQDKPPILMLKYAIDDDRIKDDLTDFIRRLLQKNPKRRFQNASEITSELQLFENKLQLQKPTSNKGFVSLRLRWTASMAGIMFIAICISLAVVYYVQKQALSGITYDYGHSIARMIAFESSEPILLDDYVGLNALIQESSKNEQLQSVYVMDIADVILASTDKALIGSEFTAPIDRELLQSLEYSNVYQRQLENKTLLLDIEMPILYADKVIGNLYISYSIDAMYNASKTTLIAMLAVMMITLFVVFIVTLVLAKQTSVTFKRLTQALNKMAMGRIDARLISEKNDESGQVFNAFNLLAQYLENRFESGNDTSIEDHQINKVVVKNSNRSNTIAETVEFKIETNVVETADDKKSKAK